MTAGFRGFPSQKLEVLCKDTRLTTNECTIADPTLETNKAIKHLKLEKTSYYFLPSFFGQDFFLANQIAPQPFP